MPIEEGLQDFLALLEDRTPRLRKGKLSEVCNLTQPPFKLRGSPSPAALWGHVIGRLNILVTGPQDHGRIIDSPILLHVKSSDTCVRQSIGFRCALFGTHPKACGFDMPDKDVCPGWQCRRCVNGFSCRRSVLNHCIDLTGPVHAYRGLRMLMQTHDPSPLPPKKFKPQSRQL